MFRPVGPENIFPVRGPCPPGQAIGTNGRLGRIVLPKGNIQRGMSSVNILMLPILWRLSRFQDNFRAQSRGWQFQLMRTDLASKDGNRVGFSDLGCFEYHVAGLLR